MVREPGLVDPIDIRRVRQPPGQSGLGRDVDEDAQIRFDPLNGKGLDRFEID